MSDYQKEAWETFKESDEDLLHCKAGVLGELGEIIDCYKKKLFTPDRYKEGSEVEEWADGLWYIAAWFTISQKVMNTDASIAGEFLDDASKLRVLVNDAPMVASLVRRNKLEILRTEWFHLAAFLGIDTEKAMRNNIDKLKKRYLL